MEPDPNCCWQSVWDSHNAQYHVATLFKPVSIWTFEQSVLRCCERWLHQIRCLIIAQQEWVKECFSLFPRLTPFLCHLVVFLGGVFLCLLSHMDVHASFVFSYPSTPFPMKLCQKMVFTPSKALSLRPVRWTAREQSPVKPAAGCDPTSSQICRTVFEEHWVGTADIHS